MAISRNRGLAQKLDDIEGVLEALVSELTPLEAEPSRGRGRPRVVPSVCLWAGVLVCLLRGFSSQLAIWRLLSQEGLWYYPRFAVSDEAIYRRLAREGSAPMAWLFGQITAALRERGIGALADDLAPFATEIYAIDETTLDPVQRKLPWLRAIPRGADATLPGKLAGVFDVRRQLWHRITYIADARQNEKVMARHLQQELAPGSLVLMDLGYFSFAWFDALTDARLLWISRLRARTSVEVIHVLVKQPNRFEAIVWLGKHRADRARYAVRLVRFAANGREHAYITNVRDPWQLPAEALVQLYARRWDIEMAVQLLKQHLKLRLLWSAKPQVLLQQIWGALIIAQILQSLRMEVARQARCDPFEISMPLLVLYVPHWLAAGTDPIALLVERGRAMRIIRPSRRVVPTLPPLDPAALVPLPHDTVLERVPRYAQRKCKRGEN